MKKPFSLYADYLFYLLLIDEHEQELSHYEQAVKWTRKQFVDNLIETTCWGENSRFQGGLGNDDERLEWLREKYLRIYPNRFPRCWVDLKSYISRLNTWMIYDNDVQGCYDDDISHIFTVEFLTKGLEDFAVCIDFFPTSEGQWYKPGGYCYTFEPYALLTYPADLELEEIKDSVMCLTFNDLFKRDLELNGIPVESLKPNYSNTPGIIQCPYLDLLVNQKVIELFGQQGFSVFSNAFGMLPQRPVYL